MNKIKQTYTITYGDQAENHVGMQKIGTMAEEGFTLSELKLAAKKWIKKGYKCELLHLNKSLPKSISGENAHVLIVRKGVNSLLGTYTHKDLLIEQQKLKVDKKAKMRGKVVNKHARWNLCFGEESQEADYKNNKGTIIAYEDVPLTSRIRDNLPKYLGDKAANLMGEMNYYYDNSKCGIGFHGDSERRIVVGIRLGDKLPLHYQWFLKSLPIGKRIELKLNGGDLYIMSSKTVGTDWKRRLIPTLRHAAGCKKYLTIKKRDA
jgi:hypothetical protein